MKKVLSILLILSSLFSLTGCLRLVGYEETTYIYLDDIEKIKKIELVKITEQITDENDENSIDYEMDILTTVSDTDKFMEDFSYLYCYTFKLLPTIGLYPDEFGVKITYASGSFEIIGAYGQVYCINGVYHITETRQYFDEEEFNAFINSYVSSQSGSEI